MRRFAAEYYHRWFVVLALIGAVGCWLRSEVSAAEELRWYKGCTHAHSLWSDGDSFPELVADWYKSHGYHFVSVTDHNVLSQGERWIDVHDKRRPISAGLIQRCGQRFGPSWIETREYEGRRQIRLKTLADYRGKLEEPGRFLLIEGEEISGRWKDRHVHICALNLAEVINLQQGDSVAETLARNYAAITQQADRVKRPILAHVNHPNWAEYDVTPEDVAQNAAIHLFEIRNSRPWVHHPFGDAVHPSLEKFWDVANTIRLTRMKAPPLFGVGSDDAHSFLDFVPARPNPGYAWTMVRASELSPEALFDAMNRGDFYASSGVTLRDVAYDAKERVVKVAVEPEPGVQYSIEFIGTPKGTDPTGQPVSPAAETNPKRPGRTYAPAIGTVFASEKGTVATYRFTGEELYVRPVVRSDKPIPNAPDGKVYYQEAWCQPVGWESVIPGSGSR